ncbi:MAG: sugar phosphate isomerase/epimerase [Oscillospiraceae bacterium]|nr:sugar phosphate isomerase/epimerase [Oscillospiraceae bacterium]
MKLGFCCPPEKAAFAKASGCDYVELNFTAIARQSEMAFAQTAALLAEAGLRAEAMNCFIPGDFALQALTDPQPLEIFLRLGMARAKALGTRVIVFGSAAARRLPAGKSKQEGWGALCPVLRLAGALAGENGLSLAIEPLRYAECNCVNTLREGLRLAALAGEANVFVLADLYHMGENGEDYADLLLAGNKLRHCHIGRPAGRYYPLPGDGYDYTPFFAALRKIGYAARLSIEAAAPGGAEGLAESIAYLRELAH